MTAAERVLWDLLAGVTSGDHENSIEVRGEVDEREVDAPGDKHGPALERTRLESTLHQLKDRLLQEHHRLHVHLTAQPALWSAVQSAQRQRNAHTTRALQAQQRLRQLRSTVTDLERQYEHMRVRILKQERKARGEAFVTRVVGCMRHASAAYRVLAQQDNEVDYNDDNEELQLLRGRTAVKASVSYTTLHEQLQAWLELRQSLDELKTLVETFRGELVFHARTSGSRSVHASLTSLHEQGAPHDHGKLATNHHDLDSLFQAKVVRTLTEECGK